jgi:hypothetical protein
MVAKYVIQHNGVDIRGALWLDTKEQAERSVANMLSLGWLASADGVTIVQRTDVQVWPVDERAKKGG